MKHKTIKAEAAEDLKVSSLPKELKHAMDMSNTSVSLKVSSLPIRNWNQKEIADTFDEIMLVVYL